MKDISPLRLAFVYSGCFFGAGYVSGQELYQFLGAFGIRGYIGLLITVTTISLCGILILTTAAYSKTARFDQLICPPRISFLRLPVGIIQILSFFSIVTVMAAGISALIYDFFAVPTWLTGAIFCTLILIASFFDMRSIVAIFSFSVPLLLLFVIFFLVYTLWQYGLPEATLPLAEKTNPLIGGFVRSALLYACLNVFAALPVITPLGNKVQKTSTKVWGILLGAMAAGIIAGSVLLVLSHHPETTATELPMLTVAAKYGAVFYYIYGFLLFTAMLGTSVSCFVSANYFLTERFTPLASHRNLLRILTIIPIYICSRIGFGNLIGTVYPLFGYVSILFLLMIFIHFLKLRHERNQLPTAADTKAPY